ncbi:MAG TPA: hypothetical protein DFS52_21815 [Myxococcales bacterium]|nr:hypothetical protein [Myxococcales bacterium]
MGKADGGAVLCQYCVKASPETDHAHPRRTVREAAVRPARGRARLRRRGRRRPGGLGLSGNDGERVGRAAGQGLGPQRRATAHGRAGDAQIGRRAVDPRRACPRSEGRARKMPARRARRGGGLPAVRA